MTGNRKLVKCAGCGGEMQVWRGLREPLYCTSVFLGFSRPVCPGLDANPTVIRRPRTQINVEKNSTVERQDVQEPPSSTAKNTPA